MIVVAIIGILAADCTSCKDYTVRFVSLKVWGWLNLQNQRFKTDGSASAAESYSYCNYLGYAFAAGTGANSKYVNSVQMDDGTGLITIVCNDQQIWFGCPEKDYGANAMGT